MRKTVFTLGLLLGLGLAGTRLDAAELNLAVADSLCSTMREIGAQYQQRHDVKLNYVCKSSGLLAKGLSGEALQADIFFSASKDWMDFAIEKNLVDRARVISPWGNTLVVAAARDNPLKLKTLADLKSDKVTQVLIGDPSTAPFGRHAKLALDNSGLWEAIKDKVETRKNHTLLAESLAQSNSHGVGLLFKTHLDGLRQLLVIEDRLHEPIRYYMAPLKRVAGDPEVARFLKFLRGESATRTLRSEGFSILAR